MSILISYQISDHPFAGDCTHLSHFNSIHSIKGFYDYTETTKTFKEVGSKTNKIKKTRQITSLHTKVGEDKKTKR